MPPPQRPKITLPFNLPMTLPPRMRPLHLRLRAWLLCCAALIGWGLAADVNASGSKTEPERPSFAFYYGQNIPWESLGAFDMVVVEPGHVTPAGWQHRGSRS